MTTLIATAGRRWALTVVVLAAATAGMLGGRGLAADAACAAPTLDPAVDEVRTGSHLRVTGEHWRTCVDTHPTDQQPEPFQDIRVLLVRDGDEHELARVDADEAGRIDVTVDVPSDLAPGRYELRGRTADGSAGGARQPVRITTDQRATSRAGGSDRVATALSVSQRTFPDGAATVYLARSDIPFDAMVAGTATDGPILLVPGCELPDTVAAEIARVNPAEVVALGGELAVCADVLDEAAQQ